MGIFSWLFRKVVAPDYASFVEHPRFGRGPQLTGLNPKVRIWELASLLTDMRVVVIPNTAIVANPALQVNATVPWTYYFDLSKICLDCQRPFIFFAEEQKHWYEVLGFDLSANCVRCVPCRKRQQRTARVRRRYENLFHEANRSCDQDLEMADCSLTLMEAFVFDRRQTERVRMLLNRAGHPKEHARYTDVIARLLALENKDSAKG